MQFPQTFGLAIGFLLPGFVATWALSLVITPLNRWFAVAESGQGVAGVTTFVVLASVAVGVAIGAVRWLLLEKAYDCIGRHWRATGLESVKLNWQRLAETDCRAAVDVLVENHYRFYLFYSNTAVALPLALACGWSKHVVHPGVLGLAGFGVVELALLLGGGSALSRYRMRLKAVLGEETG